MVSCFYQSLRSFFNSRISVSTSPRSLGFSSLNSATACFVATSSISVDPSSYKSSTGTLSAFANRKVFSAEGAHFPVSHLDIHEASTLHKSARPSWVYPSFFRNNWIRLEETFPITCTLSNRYCSKDTSRYPWLYLMLFLTFSHASSKLFLA